MPPWTRGQGGAWDEAREAEGPAGATPGQATPPPAPQLPRPAGKRLGGTRLPPAGSAPQRQACGTSGQWPAGGDLRLVDHWGWGVTGQNRNLPRNSSSQGKQGPQRNPPSSPLGLGSASSGLPQVPGGERHGGRRGPKAAGSSSPLHYCPRAPWETPPKVLEV